MKDAFKTIRSFLIRYGIHIEKDGDGFTATLEEKEADIAHGSTLLEVSVNAMQAVETIKRKERLRMRPENGRAKIHRVKLLQSYFDKVATGDKTFEVRLNDRDYREGDHVIMEEYIPETNMYTGRILVHVISYVILGPTMGIADGWCVFGVRDQHNFKNVLDR